jgi:hypothetical protein
VHLEGLSRGVGAVTGKLRRALESAFEKIRDRRRKQERESRPGRGRGQDGQIVKPWDAEDGEKQGTQERDMVPSQYSWDKFREKKRYTEAMCDDMAHDTLYREWVEYTLECRFQIG